MPVDYRIEKLVVEGFRGFRNFEMEFPASAPVYLVGANNSGKSTVLNAIALALRGGAFQRFVPTEYDFFHDAKGESNDRFSIHLHFGSDDPSTLPAVQGVGDPIPVYGVRAEGRTNNNGRFDSQNILFTAETKDVLFSDRTALKADKKEAYHDHHLGWRRQYARLPDISEFLPEVWQLSPENLFHSLFDWRTGPLQRLARLLTRRFLETEWEFSYQDKTQRMPETMKRVHGFFGDAVQAFPFWQQELKPRLETTLSKYLGREAKVTLQPGVQKIEEWLAQQLAAAFASDAGGAVTPLDRMGDGWQSLVRIAALDVLRQFPEETRERVVLLFEEPETHLHPHLRRKLRDVLSDLSELGWLVVCSTHAPEFVSFQRTQSVVRLSRAGDEVSHRTFVTSGAPNEAKWQEKLDEQGNHEMLFANRIVLCEGKDDYSAVRLYLEKADTDLDGRSVTILGVGSVHNLPAYARIAKRLGIPWCGVMDEDKAPDGAVDPKTAKTRKIMEPLLGKTDMLAVWPGSLERSLGLTSGKATPEWQDENVTPLELLEIRRKWPDFDAVCEQVRAWIQVGT